MAKVEAAVNALMDALEEEICTPEWLNANADVKQNYIAMYSQCQRFIQKRTEELIRIMEARLM